MSQDEEPLLVTVTAVAPRPVGQFAIVYRLPDGTARVAEGDLTHGIKVPADATIEDVIANAPPGDGAMFELLVDGKPWTDK